MDRRRRQSDQLENLSDHDLLIVNTTKIESLHEKIDIFLLVLDKKADSYHMRWVIGLIVLIIISISGTVWQTNNSVADIKSKIAVHTEILKENSK